MIKLTPRFKPSYDYKEILVAINPWKGNIEQFENEFSEKFQCDHGVMFPYGRSGLYALFKIWDLKNSEIICPAYTCVVVPHALVLSGNIPVFVDCQEGSFNMDLDGIRNAITDKTRAVIVTHIFGYPADIRSIERIVSDAQQKYGHKIYIVQDVAHSFGCRWNGEIITKFGDAAVFGLGISKIINSISGGMVITNDSETYNKLKEYRKNNFVKSGLARGFRKFLYLVAVYCAFNQHMYYFVNWLERRGFLDRLVKYYDESKIDFPKDWNQLPSQLEARVGLVQLQKYEDIIHTRIAKAKEYTSRLKNEDGIKIFPFVEGATYSHFVALVENRNEWLEKYRKRGIQLGILIEYSVPYLRTYLKYKRGEYPISKYYSQHCINFPNLPGIKIKFL